MNQIRSVAPAQGVQEQGQQCGREENVYEQEDIGGPGADQDQHEEQEVEGRHDHPAPITGLFLIGDPEPGEDGPQGQDAEQAGAFEQGQQPENGVDVQQHVRHVQRLGLAPVEPLRVGHFFQCGTCREVFVTGRLLPPPPPPFVG